MNVARDFTLTLLTNGLDALSARQAAIAQNLANVETPNYKAVDVAFEQHLRQALARSRTLGGPASPQEAAQAFQEEAERLATLRATPYRRNQSTLRRDGNNVDVEAEMAYLAETALRYQALSTLASKKLAMLRLVAQESR